MPLYRHSRKKLEKCVSHDSGIFTAVALRSQTHRTASTYQRCIPRDIHRRYGRNEEQIVSHDQFDAAILLALGECNTFGGLCGRLGARADEIAGKDRLGTANGWRLIDRRLQALRKVGTITYSRKDGWRVVDQREESP
jgi:hypothetical protein